MQYIQALTVLNSVMIPDINPNLLGYLGCFNGKMRKKNIISYKKSMKHRSVWCYIFICFSLETIVIISGTYVNIWLPGIRQIPGLPEYYPLITFDGSKLMIFHSETLMLAPSTVKINVTNVFFKILFFFCNVICSTDFFIIGTSI